MSPYMRYLPAPSTNPLYVMRAGLYLIFGFEKTFWDIEKIFGFEKTFWDFEKIFGFEKVFGILKKDFLI